MAERNANLYNLFLGNLYNLFLLVVGTEAENATKYATF